MLFFNSFCHFLNLGLSCLSIYQEILLLYR